MSTSVWDLKIRELGPNLAKNFSLKGLSAGCVRLVQAYRSKYITCRGARMLPFWHLVGMCMVFNYMVDFNHLKHQRWRKHH